MTRSKKLWDPVLIGAGAEPAVAQYRPNRGNHGGGAFLRQAASEAMPLAFIGCGIPKTVKATYESRARCAGVVKIREGSCGR